METRSTFVTVVAWVFIIGSGFGSLAAIMQVIAVSIMFSRDDLPAMPADVPLMTQLMYQYLNLVVYGFSLLVIFTFISAIGLLKRKNWARLTFIVILGFAIFWQLGSIAMQLAFFPEITATGEGFKHFDNIYRLFQVFAIVTGIGVSGIFAWIIKKISTSPIAEEFTSGSNKQQE